MNRRHSDETQRTGTGDRGATLVEYILVASLVLLVALAGVSAAGDGEGDRVDESADRVVIAGGGTFDG
ncbi:MAG: hypothetical protein RIB98_16840 [Acidimicrobiales bacterium]